MSEVSCIVCPPGIDYEYMYQRPQQLLRACSNLGTKVIYISPTWSLVSKSTGNLPATGENFYLVRNTETIEYLKSLSPVVYFSSPASLTDAIRLKPSLIIFDSVDYPGEEFASWYPDYELALKAADIVLASSKELYHAALSVNPSTYLIPNACDYEFFSQDRLPVPDDMPTSGPIIGYCGAMASWCDWELVECLADYNPEWQLVMIGPLYNIRMVPCRPNIHWLDLKPYNHLPGYLTNFDVGIIPFKISKMTQAVNPIKLWEYLAAGIPVVSTDLPEARGYGELVLTAKDAAAFVNQVRKAQDENSPDLKTRRRKLAEQNTWEIRAHQVLRIIAQHLRNHQPISQGFTDLSVLKKLTTPTIAFTKAISLSMRGSRS